MISNQILQNTIEGLKAITRIDLCVMDIEGKVLASTFSNAEDGVFPDPESAGGLQGTFRQGQLYQESAA